MPTRVDQAQRRWPFGSGEVAQRVREHDWAATALGPIEAWPQSLKHAAETTLAAPFASVLLWGPEYTIVAYNDGYRRILNEKPEALGRPVLKVWAEEGDLLEPQLARVLNGETLSFKELPMSLKRGFETDEAWFDYGYGPVRDESGEVAGILVTIGEITHWMADIRSARQEEARQALSLQLSDALRPLADAHRIQGATARLLREHCEVGWCYCCEFDHTGHVITVAQASTRGELPSLAGQHDFNDMLQFLALWQAGKIVCVENVQTSSLLSPRAKARYATAGINALLGVPVLKEGVLIAALILADARPQPWLRSTIDLAADSAERTWTAVGRARADAAQRESEARYRTLFEAIDSGFCIIEVIFDESGRATDYRFVEANPSFERQSGLVSAVGRRIRELAPDLENQWFERYGRVALTGEPIRVEGQVPQLGRWFDINAFRVGAPEQRRVAVLFKDISARKQAEEALRRAEELKAFLLKLADTLRRLADPNAIQYEACRLLAEQLLTDRAYYVEIDEAVGVARVVRDFVRGKTQSLSGPHRLVDYGWSIAILRRGECYAISDTQTSELVSEAERPASAALQLIANIGVPLIKNERLVGALCVSEGRPRDWTEADVDLVREVGERIWAAAEQARAEAALRGSEERWRQFADATPDVIWIRNTADLRMDYASPAFEAVYGVPRDVASSGDSLRWWGKIILPEDRAGAFEAIRRVRAGETFTHEFRIKRPSDGAVRWVRNTDFPLSDGDGRPARIGGIGQDVTELKHIEAAMAESEERFRSFAENSADTLWIVDAETRRLEYLSPAFETIWGEPRERVMGNLARWGELLHPEDRARAAEGMPRLLSGEVYSQQYRIVRASDGAVRWIQDTGFPIRGESGQVRRVAGFAQDITARKQGDDALRRSSRRLRSLVEGIPQLVWRAIDGGHWTWSSPQWTTCTGLSEEASRGHGWLQAVHPDDRVGAMAAWRSAQASDRFEVEYRLRHASKARYRWFSTRATAVRDEATGEVEWLGTSTDIDELRSLHEHQKLLLAELQHRVRNTLAVVRSIARRTATTSDTVEDYAAHFDGRLNAFARTQAIVTRDPASGISLEYLVAEELLAHGAHERGGRADGGRVRIEGPEIRLQPKAAETFGLAIHELATNAVKHGVLSSSVRRGRVAVSWQVQHGSEPNAVPTLRFVWHEAGSRVPVGPPQRRGFGTELLERTLKFELKARTTMAFEPAGLRCTIELPLTDRMVWSGFGPFGP